MVRWFVSLVLALALALSAVPMAHSGNTHNTLSPVQELGAWFGDGSGPFIASGCAPTVPSSALILAAFACKGYVRATDGSLVYVDQPAHTLGPVSNVNGIDWLAIHRNTSQAVGGWTREPGTHYLWQRSATRPADPAEGLVVASWTVAGAVITTPFTTGLAPDAPISASLGVVLVHAHATAGDGSTLRPWTGWDTAIAWAASTSYLFKSGVYSYASAPAWAHNSAAYVALGPVTLQHTGTGIGVNFDASGPSSIATTVCCITMSEGFSFNGNANTTDGWFIRGVFHSRFHGLRANNLTAAALHTQWAVDNSFYDFHSSRGNEDVTETVAKPAKGIFLDTHPAGGGPSNANNFYAPIIQNRVDCVKIVGASGNNFFGGNLEACNNGAVVGPDAGWNNFYGVWLEQSTVADYYIYGIFNTINGGHSTQVNVVDGALAGGYGNTFAGGTYTRALGTFDLKATSVGNTIRDTVLYGVIGDTGVNNQLLNNYRQDLSRKVTDIVSRNDNGAGATGPWVRYQREDNIAYGFEIGFNRLLGANGKAFFTGTIQGGSSVPLQLAPGNGGIEIGSTGSIGTLTKFLSATGVVDFASIAAAAHQSVNVTVTGAALGDTAMCSLTVSLQELSISGYVASANTVTCTLANNTAGAVDLASATLRADVWQH